MAELLTALTETEARLHIMAQAPSGGPFSFIRKWQFVDATYADDLVKAAPATVTNPYVDGQAHVGTYYLRREWAEPHEPGNDQDERVVTVFQDLTYAIDKISFYSRQTGLADDRTYLYRRNTDYIAAPVDSQGQIYQVENSINEDNTYDNRLVASLSTEANVAFTFKRSFTRLGTAWVYKNQRASISCPGLSGTGAYEEKQDINTDLTYDTLLMYEGSAGTGIVEFISEQATLQDQYRSVYRDWPTAVAAPPDQQGTIYRADNSITEMGLYNSQVDRITSTAASASMQSADTYLGTTTTTVLRNQAATTAASAAAFATLEQTTNNINLDGTYDAEKRSVASKESLIFFPSSRQTASVANTYAYQNFRTQFGSALTASAGTAFRVDQRMNPDATYDGQIIQMTSQASQADFDSLRSPLRTDHSWIYRGGTTVIEGGVTTGQGIIYDANNQLQEDGSYISSFVRQTSSPYDAYTAWDTIGGTAWLYTCRNQTTMRTDLDAVFTADAYGSNVKSVSINPDLTYDLLFHHTPPHRVGDLFHGANATWVEHFREYRDVKGSTTAARQYRNVQIQVYAQFNASLNASATFMSGHPTMLDKGPEYWGGAKLWRGLYYEYISEPSVWTTIT